MSAEFNGTIKISSNPTTAWEEYSHTFLPSNSEDTPGYFGLSKEERAEQGFYKCKFSVREDDNFIADFLENGAARMIELMSNDGRLVWEGLIGSMEYDRGNVVYRSNIKDMANRVWVRYRIRGTATTERSVVYNDTDSQGKYGIKSFILSGGELESTDIADSLAQQYLDLHAWPVPTPSSIDLGAALDEKPRLTFTGIGYFQTMNWNVFNQTASTDAQGVSSQIGDIIGDSDVGQFIKSNSIQANGVSVSKVYDADRRGGDIVSDLSRLGNSENRRFISYMTDDRKFIYSEAQPPENL